MISGYPKPRKSYIEQKPFNREVWVKGGIKYTTRQLIKGKLTTHTSLSDLVSRQNVKYKLRLALKRKGKVWLDIRGYRITKSGKRIKLLPDTYSVRRKKTFNAFFIDIYGFIWKQIRSWSADRLWQMEGTTPTLIKWFSKTGGMIELNIKIVNARRLKRKSK